ncbi:MAG: Mobile element protein, partial [Olavius algarvensis Gamma 1 endosymbiont]
VHCASSGADVDTSNSITSLARNNDSILDPMQSSGTQQQIDPNTVRNHFKRYRTEGLAGLNRVGEGVGGS